MVGRISKVRTWDPTTVVEWPPAGEFHDQWYMRRRVIEKDSVCLLVMFSQALAVISNHNDDGWVVPAVLL